MRLGRTVGKILVLFAPGSAASKSINLSKYPRLSKLFNTAEANAKDTLKIDLKASSGKNIFGWDKTKTIKASDLQDYARKQGWHREQTAGGPEIWKDENNVKRLTIKRGSSRTPGSNNPHVEIRNAQGKRIDIDGNLVTRKSPQNHTPIEYDLWE